MEVAGANVVGRFRFALERFGSPRHRSHVAQLWSLGHLRTFPMKRFISLLGLVALGAGCQTGDVVLRDRVVGTWQIETASVSYRPDGSFQFENSAGSFQWRNGGTWSVKQGNLINVVTYSSAENTAIKVPVGRVGQGKITFVDAHQLVIQDGGGVHPFWR